MFADESSITTEFYDDEYTTFHNLGGTFTTSSDIAVFSWLYDATYIDDGDNYDSLFTFTVEYDQNSGMLKRYRFDLDMVGTYDYNPIDIENHQEIVVDDYTEENSLFTIPWLIFTNVISFIMIIYTINRKKK